MESLYVLIPLSVAVVLLIGWVFWRALEGGQFDDLEGPGYSILGDEEPDSAQDPPRQSQGSDSSTRGS